MKIDFRDILSRHLARNPTAILNLVPSAFSSTIFKMADRLKIVEEKALGTRLQLSWEFPVRRRH